MKDHYEDEMNAHDHDAVEQMVDQTTRSDEYQKLVSSDPESHQQAIADANHDDKVLNEIAGRIANLATMANEIRRLRDTYIPAKDEFEPGSSAWYPTPTDERINQAADISASLVYDIAIYGKIALKELDDMTNIVKARTNKALAIAAELMSEEGTSQIARHGQLLYLSEDRFIKPRISDLLPEGVDEKDPRYAQTVATCKEAAKSRLLEAMKNSELSDLVSEGYNANSFRSRIVGSNADLDEDGEPIIPEAIADLIDIDSVYKAKTRKSSSKAPKSKK